MTDFTTEQLLALAKGLGLADPLFLREPPVVDWPPEVRNEVESLGVRSLMARNVVRVDDGRLQVPFAVRQLMVPLVEATVVTTMVRSGGTGNTLAQLYSHRGLTTAHQPSFGGNHRLRLFPSRVIGAAIVRLMDLRKTPAPDGDTVELPADQTESYLRDLLEAVSAVPGSDAASDLSAPELDLGQLEGIGDDLNINSVTVTRKASTSSVHGVAVSWIDDGAGGYHVIDQKDDVVVISPASGDEVLSQIMWGYTDGSAPDLTDVAWDEASASP